MFTSGWGVRHTYACVAFLAGACCYFMRMSLSVTIVAMVNTSEWKKKQTEKAFLHKSLENTTLILAVNNLHKQILMSKLK